jgi:hypothetical protein
MFRSNILPSSSELKNKPYKYPAKSGRKSKAVGSKFLRNVTQILPGYTALHSKRYSYRCENLSTTNDAASCWILNGCYTAWLTNQVWTKLSRDYIKAALLCPECSWLRHYATGWKVAGSIPDEVIGFFNWPNLPAALRSWVRLSL